MTNVVPFPPTQTSRRNSTPLDKIFETSQRAVTPMEISDKEAESVWAETRRTGMADPEAERPRQDYPGPSKKATIPDYTGHGRDEAEDNLPWRGYTNE